MKTWSPRFGKPLNEKMRYFNASISFDFRLAKYDIISSVAHAKMLHKVGLLTDKELDQLTLGFEKISLEIETRKFKLNVEDEDIHFAIQNALVKEIGDVGKKIHTARSRNDQVATDLRLYTRDHVDIVIEQLNELVSVFEKVSEKHESTIMCGYTHLQKAIPTTYGRYLDAYQEIFIEDKDRLLCARKG